MKLKYLLLFILPLFFTKNSFSQSKIVQVNHATGTANVVIPLYTVNSGKISLPMTLVYSATGVRVNDAEGSAGVGWDLNVGGAITREVRGLPDDCTKDVIGNKKLGWMSFNDPTYNSSSNFIANSNAGTCQDENNDVFYIKDYLSNKEDTEPDIFNVEAPGLSCKLVFDQMSNSFHTIPYQDYKISYTVDTNNNIVSFTITNDKGIVYTFSTTQVFWSQTASYNNNTPAYFTLPFLQFLGDVTTYNVPVNNLYNPSMGVGQNLSYNVYSTSGGGVKYINKWDLTSITDIYGNFVNFSYIQGTTKTYASPVNVFIGSATVNTDLYVHSFSYTPNLISQITYGDAANSRIAFTFTWETNPTTKKSFISLITGFRRNFQFNYSNIVYTGNNDKFNRYFLNNVIDPGCGTPFNYGFSYCKPETLPDSTSSAIDYWGYYNGQTGNTSLKPDIKINPSNASYSMFANPETINSPTGATPSSNYTSTYPSGYEITGSNRQTAPFSTTNYYSPNTIGTLTQINYGNGGYTKLTYEPNDYYDALINGTVLGGGIRITSITDFQIDNTKVGGPPTSSTFYSYLDPATGYSSGKPVSLPVFAFATPYSGTATGAAYSIASTVSSYADLSDEDHTIYYGVVTETMAGTGKILHYFSTPATNGALAVTAPSLPWQPTTDYVGRFPASDGTCPSIGVLTNSVNTYPFAPNPNYDFERGLPTKTIDQNDAGIEVNETDYTYNTPTPYVINAFKFDYNNLVGSTTAAYNYSKYIIYTSTTPLITQVYNKLYDLSSTTSSKQSTTNYVYGSSKHEKPTQISFLNSDGSVRSTNVIYSKDYVIPSSATPGDTYAAGIQNLQNNNINEPVESYNQFTPAGTGQTTVTTSAQLTKFGMAPFLTGASLGMPMQKLSFTLSSGISNFQHSSISGTYTFVSDPNYVVTENDLAYDDSGNLASFKDASNHVRTISTNHYNSQPEAIIDNANHDEFAFQDFDNSDFEYQFKWLGTKGSYAVAPGRVGNGETMSSAVTLSKTITKSTLATNYIFSAWINWNTPGTFNISVSGTGSTGTVTNNASINYATPSAITNVNGWQYYEVVVPLTGITSSTFSVGCTTSQSITIDDILFYPDVSQTKTFGYDMVSNLVTAETDANGVSTYYKIDPYGRVNYVYDQDMNIKTRTTYASLSNIESSIGPGSSNGLTNFPVTFASNFSGRSVTFVNTSFSTPCMPGVSINWTFGDGTTSVTTSGTNYVIHTYSAAGTYPVTMAFFNGPTVTNSITIQ